MKANVIYFAQRNSPPVPPDLDDLIYLACQEKQRCFAGSRTVLRVEKGRSSEHHLALSAIAYALQWAHNDITTLSSCSSLWASSVLSVPSVVMLLI